ncbi:MAG: hypothetical protein ABS81_17195 [Pseudonocardia sp. SCN 72-86]|mgnify:CR=1 FL=1|nr:MAG: hypothetical protein ABS81_17195 [Pseudonocardia sp. SCN 72-86]
MTPDSPVAAADRSGLLASVAERLYRVGTDTQRFTARYARARGLLLSEVHALVELAVAELRGAVATPRDLGQALMLTSGAVTALVDRLEVHGLVFREQDRADRRRVRLRCAADGRMVVDDLAHRFEARTHRLVAWMPADELAVVDRFLRAVDPLTGGPEPHTALPSPRAASSH